MSGDRDNNLGSDEDFWPREAGRVAREEIEAEDRRRLDPRWDAYAAGELPLEEQEDLLRSSGEARQAAELFRPLDPGLKEELARRALAEVEAPRKPRQGPPEKARRPAGPVHRFPGRYGRAWGLGLAAAAAVIALFGLRLLTGGGALPAFELEVSPGAAAQRSAPESFAAGDPLEIRLRPATATRLRPELRIYAHGPGRLERWKEAEERVPTPNENGVILFQAPAWEFGPGEWTLAVVLGSPGALPPEAEIRAILGTGLAPPPEAGWQLLERELVVAEAVPDS